MSMRDDPLEGRLRSAEAPIGDDGFSERLLARLPRRKRSTTLSRRATLAAAAGVGSLATILLGAPIEGIFDSLSAVGNAPTVLLSTLAIVAILAAPAVWFFYVDRGEG